MSFKAILAEAEKTRLLILTANGKPYAMRACIYSLETYQFSYYDFILASVKNVEHQKFINQRGRNMEKVPLIDLGNGRMATQDEIDGTIVAQEFTSEEQVEKLLGYLVSVLKEQEYYTKAVTNNE